MRTYEALRAFRYSNAGGKILGIKAGQTSGIEDFDIDWMVKGEYIKETGKRGPGRPSKAEKEERAAWESNLRKEQAEKDRVEKEEKEIQEELEKEEKEAREKAEQDAASLESK